MISVIIPLHNKSKYISKCIKSVLSQTFTEFELIIVNDGSTDESVSIVKQFTDRRIRLINQVNSGVSTARNNGVYAAKYDFISFLDADDWWSEDFLKKMLLLVNDFPEAGIFGCQYFSVKSNQLRVSINHKEANYRGYINYFKAYTFGWWMPLTSISVVLKRQIFSTLGGFNSVLRFGEDFDLWIKFATKHKVAYLNVPLAFYNQDVDSANRAVGGVTLYPPVSHFIFNLAYLSPIERGSTEVKQLLDGLRVRSILPYHLAGSYSASVQAVLQEVDFSQQSIYFKRVYHSPLLLVRLYFGFMRLGSVVKQYLLRLRW